MKDYAPAEEKLVLKAGAFVVLTIDLSPDFPRGSQGFVLCASPETSYNVIVCFLNGRMVEIQYHMFEVPITPTTSAWVAQIPLKLAWYYSVSDVRGGYSWTHIKTDMNLLRGTGSFYRLLGQIRHVSSLCLENINVDYINMNFKALLWNKKLMES